MDSIHELLSNFARNFPLENTDVKCKVYYDESNNYRKVYIKNRKLNILKDGNFVLARSEHRHPHRECGKLKDDST